MLMVALVLSPPSPAHMPVARQPDDHQPLLPGSAYPGRSRKDRDTTPFVHPVRVDPPTSNGDCPARLQRRRSWWRRMKRENSAASSIYRCGAIGIRRSSSRRVRVAGLIIIFLASKLRRSECGKPTAIRIGFLVDWGQGSPLYPAAAAAAAKGAAESLARSGVFSSVGPDIDIAVEWVWHDSACDAEQAFEAAEVLLDEYGVDVIVGPACCRAAAAASSVAHSRGVPVISWACSAEYVSDKTLYPSLLRVVGSSSDFAAAVGALFRRQGWARASILYAQGAERGLAHSVEAWQIRWVFEEQQVSLGTWEGFDGAEVCSTGAGDALAVRRAVEAVESAGDSVVIVAGECADYRQVMTYAASRGLRSGRTWLLFGGARDPECHVSASTCGRDDGRDSLALSSMSGALSIDWSSSSTSRVNDAAYAAATAAYYRESFAADFAPPPAGNASPMRALCSSSEDGGEVVEGAVSYRDECSPKPSSRGQHRQFSFLSRLGMITGDVGSSVGSVFSPGGGGGHGGDDVDIDGDDAASEGGSERLPAACERRGSHAVDGNGHGAVPAGAPAGVLHSAALMFDAVELGGRLLAAGAEVGADQVRRSRGGWAGLASAVEFEGLTGKVSMDSRGNRHGMDVSFWLMEGTAVNGCSYTMGREAVRFTHATGQVQLLQEIDWPVPQPRGPRPWDSHGLNSLLLGLTAVTTAAAAVWGAGQLLVIRWSHRRQQHNQQQQQQQQDEARPGVDVLGRDEAGREKGSPASDPPRASRGASASPDKASILSNGGSRLSVVSGTDPREAAPPPARTPVERSLSRTGCAQFSKSLNVAKRPGDVSPPLSVSDNVAASESMARIASAAFPRSFDSNASRVGEVRLLATVPACRGNTSASDRGQLEGKPRVTPPTKALTSLPSDATFAAGATPSQSLPTQITPFTGVGNPPPEASSHFSSQLSLAMPPQWNGIALSRTEEAAMTAEETGEAAAGRAGVSPRSPGGAGFQMSGSEEAVEGLPGNTNAADGTGDDICDLNAFSPLSKERVQIVLNELEKMNDHAKRALKEVEVDDNEISIGTIIGSGSFAEVRHGRLKGFRSDGVGLPIPTKTSDTIISRARSVGPAPPKIAVKVLRDVKRQAIRRFWIEVLIMKDLDHPNIVRLLGATWTGRGLMMILGHVSRGNLTTVLEEWPRLDWKDRKFGMCLDIAKGMAYLHSFRYLDELSNSMQNCVIHRDLKPENLLVTNDFRIKITDFGEATGKGNDDARTQVGTLLYIAPEIIRGDRYDERCDVYSFAIVLLAMLQLKDDILNLFADEVRRRKGGKTTCPSTYSHMAITNIVVNENLRPTLPGQVFGTLKILIEQCWSPTPALRPTFDEIIEFLDEIAKDEIVNGQRVEDDPDMVLDGVNLEHGDTVKSAAGPAAPENATALASGSSPTPDVMSAAGATSEELISAAEGRQWPEAEMRLEMAHMSYSREPFVPAGRGKKRGKDYRPAKGNMAMEFLGRHRDLSICKTAPTPSTIVEDEGESEGTVHAKSAPEVATCNRTRDSQEIVAVAFGSRPGTAASPVLARPRAFETNEDKRVDAERDRGAIGAGSLQDAPCTGVHSRASYSERDDLGAFSDSESGRWGSGGVDWGTSCPGAVRSLEKETTAIESANTRPDWSSSANANDPVTSAPIDSAHPRSMWRSAEGLPAASPAAAATFAVPSATAVPRQPVVDLKARIRRGPSGPRGEYGWHGHNLDASEIPVDPGDHPSRKPRRASAPATGGEATKRSLSPDSSESSWFSLQQSGSRQCRSISSFGRGLGVDVDGALSLLLRKGAVRDEEESKDTPLRGSFLTGTWPTVRVQELEVEELEKASAVPVDSAVVATDVQAAGQGAEVLDTKDAGDGDGQGERF